MTRKRKATGGYTSAKKRRISAYSGSYTRRRRYRSLRGKGKLAGAIKRQLISMAEPKHFDSNFGKLELYHNSGSPVSGQILPALVTFNTAASMPDQGVGDQNRVGDQIYSKGFKLRMLFGQKADRHNVTFRVIVTKATSVNQPTTYAQLFDASTLNCLLDTINTDRQQVLYHKYIKMKIHPDLSGVGGADKEFTFVKSIWIPYKKLFKFSADGGTVGTGTDPGLRVYFLAYDAYGTLLTDNIAYVQVYSRFYFSDP